MEDLLPDMCRSTKKRDGAVRLFCAALPELPAAERLTPANDPPAFLIKNNVPLSAFPELVEFFPVGHDLIQHGLLICKVMDMAVIH